MRAKYLSEISIGTRIRELRKSRGLTQKQFADSLGIVQGFLSGIEQGKKPANITLLSAICHRYGVSEEWLRTGSGIPEDGGGQSVPVGIPLLRTMPPTFPEGIGPSDVVSILQLPERYEGCFAMVAEGDFMAPTIKDGDLVVFAPATVCRNRQVVLLANRWGETILRRCRMKGDDLYFSPENSVYAPFKADADSRLYGEVVTVWRKVSV